MNVNEALIRVDSKETFLNFLKALRDDCGNEKWENQSIDAFLDAMHSWASASSTITGKPTVSDEPTWRGLAEILRAGAFYE